MKRAFTLLELLIAVAAGALLTLAIAQVFATTGGTVQRGKRASNFNRYAALIEQQLREDFQSMSREGFLLIRHEVANRGPTQQFRPERVSLYAAEPDRLQRYRRIDEILFFERGTFSTARAPLSPDVNAVGHEARIYIGHGAKVHLDDLSAAEMLALTLPEYDMGIDSQNLNLRDAMGLLGETLTANEFASEWTLLRHVTVLSQPLASEATMPTANFFNIGPPFSTNEKKLLQDSDRQIAFQPALPSIFRSINFGLRLPTGEQDIADDSLRGPNNTIAGAFPRTSTDWWLDTSGLFDIATTDLREIRAIVTTALHDGAAPPAVPVPRFPIDIGTGGDLRDNPPRGTTPVLDLSTSEGQSFVSAIHAWMRDALPGDTSGDGPVPELHGRRMRAEASPPRLLDVLDPENVQPTPLAFTADSFEAADRLNDQLALVSSNFVPRCSEFMVEWSFNQVNLNTGETIWYGGNELFDTNGDDIADDVHVTRYSSANPADPDEPGLFFDRVTGHQLPADNGTAHLVSDILIHGPAPTSHAEEELPVVSYFGYHDPTYAPVNSTELSQLPWAWPKLFRVTVTLVDPNDPSIEQTYQFVFKAGQTN